MKRPLLLVCAAALLLIGCDAPTVPARTDVYRFHDPQRDWNFRWANGSTIRLHVLGEGESGAQLEAWTRQAAQQWNAASLFQDYTLRLTERLDAADVLVRWSNEPLPVNPPSAEEASCFLPGGSAYVVFCVSLGAPRVLRMPLVGAAAGGEGNVRAYVTIGAFETDTAQARRLVLHELGHILGIWAHSEGPDDVMAGGLVQVDVLSAADRATIHVLYRTQPTVGY